MSASVISVMSIPAYVVFRKAIVVPSGEYVPKAPLIKNELSPPVDGIVRRTKRRCRTVV